MQTRIDDVNVGIAKFLELAAIDGYGIVSDSVEAVSQNKLAVSFNEQFQRLQVTPGTFVTPAGQVFTVPSQVSDLLWPETHLLYVVLYSGMTGSNAVDAYGDETLARTVPSYYLAVLTHDDLKTLGSAAVVIAVLRRSVEIDEVDVTNIVLPQNRHVFSIYDLEHEAQGKEVGDPRNPHGLGLDQVRIGGVSLLRQMHPYGFIVAKDSEAAGVPGTFVAKTIEDQAQVDPVGRVVLPGHFYIVLDAYPTQMPKVVSTTTEAEIKFTWKPGTNVFDFGTTDPGSIRIEYFQVKDAEISSREVSQVVEFKPASEGAVISDGSIVYPEPGRVDVSAYAGLALDIDVLADANGGYTLVPEMVGSIRPAQAKSPTTALPYTLQSVSQLAFGVVGSGLAGRVQPPMGRLDVTGLGFSGRYRFMYTVSVPAVTETLSFVSTGFGSWSAQVQLPGGTLLRGRKVVNPRYYNIVDGVMYLETRAYDAKSVFTYTIPAEESKRFIRGYTEATGTNEKPSGLAAKGSIHIFAPLSVGDAVVVQFDTVNPIVRKVFGTDFTGADLDETAVSLAAALNSDALFRIKALAYATENTVVVTAKALGSEGNSYIVTVDASTASTKFAVYPMTGGSSYKPTIQDVTGCVLRLRQPNQGFPAGSKLRVYMTNDLDQGGDEKLYYHVNDVGLVSGAHVYDLALTQPVTDGINTNAVGYDLGGQFNATVVVQGQDGNGGTVTDTVVLADNTIFETNAFGDPLQFVTTQGAYASVTSVVVTEAANIGAVRIVVLGQALSRNSSKSRVAEIATSREGVTAVRDTRIMHPASLTSNPVTQSAALYFGLSLTELA